MQLTELQVMSGGCQQAGRKDNQKPHTNIKRQPSPPSGQLGSQEKLCLGDMGSLCPNAQAHHHHVACRYKTDYLWASAMTISGGAAHVDSMIDVYMQDIK